MISCKTCKWRVEETGGMDRCIPGDTVSLDCPQFRPKDPVIRIKKLVSTAQVPGYQSAGAAGLDLCTIESAQIRSRERILVGTGIAVAIPDGFVGLIRDRSSMAKQGIHVLAGVIDSDYRGEILVLLLNTSFNAVSLTQGQRVAQLLILPCLQFSIVEGELDSTDRGEGGFGSTGR